MIYRIKRHKLPTTLSEMIIDPIKRQETYVLYDANQETKDEQAIFQRITRRAEKHVLLLANGKFAKLQKCSDKIIDVFGAEDFTEATFLSEDEADLALIQQHNLDQDKGIVYDFDELQNPDNHSFVKKIKVQLELLDEKQEY